MVKEPTNKLLFIIKAYTALIEITKEKRNLEDEERYWKYLFEACEAEYRRLSKEDGSITNRASLEALIGTLEELSQQINTEYRIGLKEYTKGTTGKNLITKGKEFATRPIAHRWCTMAKIITDFTKISRLFQSEAANELELDITRERLDDRQAAENEEGFIHHASVEQQALTDAQAREILLNREERYSTELF